MQKFYFRIMRIFSIVAMAALMLAACALTHEKPPEEALRERVIEMMNARIQLDWGKVYTYFDSSCRKNETKESFLNKQKGFSTTAFVIEGIAMQPSGTTATVKLKCDYNAKGYDFKNTPETQNWIKEDGRWYLQVKNDKAEGTPQ